MSVAAGQSREARREGSSLPPARPPTWRSKLAESWPLLFAGSGCVALAVVWAVQGTSRSIDHLSPTFLFLALGMTGLAGGIASFMAGPDEDSESSPMTRQASWPMRLHPSQGGKPADPAGDRSYGRPAPDVTRAEWSESSTTTSIPPWSEEAEISPSLLLDGDTYRRPSIWSKGRVLRLSEEGVLTVYSLDDALRDLEIVNQVVHGRRVDRDANAADKSGTSPD